MLYRAAILAIVIFWGAMWTLLIRSEVQPQETAWRSVPLELVLRQVFTQAQASDLRMMNNGVRAGHLRIIPKTEEETGMHHLDLIGDVRLSGEGPRGAQAFWDVDFTLNPNYTVRRVRGTTTVRAPGQPTLPASRLEFLIEPAAGQGHYRLSMPEEAPVEQDFTLDEAGLRAVIGQWGVNEELLKGFTGRGPTLNPEITARQTRLTVQGEQVETYLLTICNQGQTLVEAHVSQLGQVLQAKTVIGWNLAPD